MHFHLSCWTHNQLWESTGNLCIQENFHLVAGNSKQDPEKLSKAKLVPCWKCHDFQCYCTSFSALKTERQEGN